MLSFALISLKPIRNLFSENRPWIVIFARQLLTGIERLL
jgi:hypothetical protein